MYSFIDMKQSTFFLVTLSAGLLSAGCGSPEEEITSSEPTRREIVFKGRPSSALVGTWKDTKGDLRYAFSKDGQYTYKGTVNTQAGPQKMDMSGEWAVDGTVLYLKDSKGETYDYDVKQSGADLSLTTKGQRKFEFKYKKEK